MSSPSQQQQLHTVLITGGCGCIAQHLTKELLLNHEELNIDKIILLDVQREWTPFWHVYNNSNTINNTTTIESNNDDNSNNNSNSNNNIWKYPSLEIEKEKIKFYQIDIKAHKLVIERPFKENQKLNSLVLTLCMTIYGEGDQNTLNLIQSNRTNLDISAKGHSLYAGNAAHAHILAFKQLLNNPNMVRGMTFSVHENNFGQLYFKALRGIMKITKFVIDVTYLNRYDDFDLKNIEKYLNYKPKYKSEQAYDRIAHYLKSLEKLGKIKLPKM
ncbi:predicted protein [Naegleria gruberi]|uniref:Predicted protein n=1 Tax=Naegleria gruberi TaxID=5762 RepID=D2W440_NAEGR|nr:uncharacterized protein NAEGRDRAFT_76170 [Naegleria gruberi]EFC36176.1 predicted protein [Naegleria gruberi]|eukprot:XP_002668920.1 predicted protein [Naegleria gruberi strain NEG-M]